KRADGARACDYDHTERMGARRRRTPGARGSTGCARQGRTVGGASRVRPPVAARLGRARLPPHGSPLASVRRLEFFRQLRTETSMDDKRALLRHTIATVAYRGGKAVRDAPASFAKFASGDPPKTP